MAVSTALQQKQFKGSPKAKKDPHASDEHDRVRFTGAEGSKTMYVHQGKLPHAPKKHPHRNHAGRRSKRAR